MYDIPCAATLPDGTVETLHDLEYCGHTSKITKEIFVSKLPNSGRWPWLGFTPSCQFL